MAVVAHPAQTVEAKVTPVREPYRGKCYLERHKSMLFIFRSGSNKNSLQFSDLTLFKRHWLDWNPQFWQFFCIDWTFGSQISFPSIRFPNSSERNSLLLYTQQNPSAKSIRTSYDFWTMSFPLDFIRLSYELAVKFDITNTSAFHKIVLWNSCPCSNEHYRISFMDVTVYFYWFDKRIVMNFSIDLCV